MAAKPDITTRLAQSLRSTRTEQGLSLDAVSRMSGVSRSMVSQIERGESSPTVATLWNLTQALGVDFAGLIDAQAGPPQISFLASDTAPTIAGHGPGCTIRILSPPEEAGRQEVYELIFDAEGALVSEAHAPGTREHLTVIDGALSVRSGDAVQALRSGDTARYAADCAHAITATTAGARAFLIVSQAK